MGIQSDTTKESEMTAANNLEENKRIVRAFIETAFNQHRADKAADRERQRASAIGSAVHAGIEWHLRRILGDDPGRAKRDPG